MIVGEVCHPIHINTKNMLARMNPCDEITVFIKQREKHELISCRPNVNWTAPPAQHNILASFAYSRKAPHGSLHHHRPQDIADAETLHSSEGCGSGEEGGVMPIDTATEQYLRYTSDSSGCDNNILLVLV
jgi:hypothetical protein